MFSLLVGLMLMPVVLSLVGPPTVSSVLDSVGGGSSAAFGAGRRDEEEAVAVDGMDFEAEMTASGSGASAKGKSTPLL